MDVEREQAKETVKLYKFILLPKYLKMISYTKLNAPIVAGIFIDLTFYKYSYIFQLNFWAFYIIVVL